MLEVATRHVFDAEVMQDPAPFDRNLLQNAPVFWDDVNQFFIVSSHALITEVVQDNVKFSSEYLEKFMPLKRPAEVQEIFARGCPFTKALLVTDGDLHRRHRKIIRQALSQERVDSMMPEIEGRIASMLDELAPRGRIRFRSEFADRIPIEITQQLLQVSDEELGQALEWSEIVTRGFGGLGHSLEQQKADAEAIVEFQAYFRKKIEAAAANLTGPPGGTPATDDIYALLASAMQEPDEPMSLAEALSFILVLIPATHDTTSGTLTACMKAFVDRPEIQTLLRDDPAQMPRFIDEAMRLESPNRGFWRRAAQDTVLNGIDVPKGSWLLMRLSAANHDPAVYSDPDVFDMDRKGAKPHLEFGSGVHFCVGRPIANRVITAVFSALTAKGENYRFTPGENHFEHEPSLLFSSYEELDVTFDKR